MKLNCILSEGFELQMNNKIKKWLAIGRKEIQNKQEKCRIYSVSNGVNVNLIIGNFRTF